MPGSVLPIALPVPMRAGRERGATLVVALIVLVLIMMLGIAAVSTSNTQYKLAGNLQFEDGALNNAETAVVAAESWLATGNNARDPAFTTPDPAKPQLLALGQTVNPLTMGWDTSNSVTVGSNSRQRYFIQLMSTANRLQGSSQALGTRTNSGCNQVNTYLITARGESARGASRIVQSFYSVLSC